MCVFPFNPPGHRSGQWLKQGLWWRRVEEEKGCNLGASHSWSLPFKNAGEKRHCCLTVLLLKGRRQNIPQDQIRTEECFFSLSHCHHPQSGQAFQYLKTTELTLPPLREGLSPSRCEVGLFLAARKTQPFIRSCDASKEKESKLQTESKQPTNAVGARSPAEESVLQNTEANVHQCI